MNINIKATHIELTDDIREHVDKCMASIGKVLDAGEDEFVGQVEVGKSSTHHQTGDIFMAEMNLRAKGENFYAVFEASTIDAALEGVKDRIISEAKKTKGKKRSLIRRIFRR